MTEEMAQRAIKAQAQLNEFGLGVEVKVTHMGSTREVEVVIKADAMVALLEMLVADCQEHLPKDLLS